jgi:DNA-binding MarR family transcriptional regulator
MQTTLSSTDVAARLRFAIVRSARRLRQEAVRAEGGPELSPTLTAALSTVDAHGPLTPSELVRRPTATRTVASLERLGLVGLTADPDDGRIRRVAATAEGRALLRRLRTRKNAYLARRLAVLDPDELEVLERAADILERILDDEGRA